MSETPTTRSSSDLSATLDSFELKLLQLVEARAGAAEFLVLRHEVEISGLKLAPPPIDPDEPRKSATELLYLINALTPGVASAHPASGAEGQRPFPAEDSLEPARIRAGYHLEERDGTAHAEPLFAQALAQYAFDRAARFRKLWAIDLKVWEGLERRDDIPTIARLWLTSPGRRLVQDLEILSRLPADRASERTAADLSLERLYQAAGVDDVPDTEAALHAWLDQGLSERWRSRPAGWLDLHTAVPGRLMNAWPATTRLVSEPDFIPRVLRQIEQASPVFLRGAALAWLLDKAVDAPAYAVAGIARSLRDDLPPRLALAAQGLIGGALEERPIEVAVELETVLLQHAARITAEDRKPGAIVRGWGVARWLYKCLVRSPFFGGDEEALTVRLRALLSREPLAPRPDPLDPARFRIDGSGLRLHELALVAGAARHYFREGRPVLQPMPLPLVDAMRRVAGRTLAELEREAEQRLAEHQVLAEQDPACPNRQNELEWSAPHVAPPLTARWLLTRQNISWLEHTPPEVQRESLQLLRADPKRHRWLPFALREEGFKLERSVEALAAEVWRELAWQVADHQARLESHELVMMAAGLLEALSAEDEAGALRLAGLTAPDWRPFILDVLLQASERAGRPGLWRDTMQACERLMSDKALPENDRLNAALMAVRRASATRHPDRNEVLEALGRLTAAPPFAAHQGLKRELRRLGISIPATSTGGGA